MDSNISAKRDMSSNTKTLKVTAKKAAAVSSMYTPIPVASGDDNEYQTTSVAESKTVFSATHNVLKLNDATNALGKGASSGFPLARVMDRIRGKIANKLAEKISCLGFGNILQALKDPEVDDAIRILII